MSFYILVNSRSIVDLGSRSENVGSWFAWYLWSAEQGMVWNSETHNASYTW